LRSQLARSDRGSLKISNEGSYKYISSLRNATKKAARLNRMNSRLSRKSTLIANTIRKKITKMNSLSKANTSKRKRSLFEKHNMLSRLSSMTKTNEFYPLRSKMRDLLKYFKLLKSLILGIKPGTSSNDTLKNKNSLHKKLEMSSNESLISNEFSVKEEEEKEGGSNETFEDEEKDSDQEVFENEHLITIMSKEADQMYSKANNRIQEIKNDEKSFNITLKSEFSITSHLSQSMNSSLTVSYPNEAETLETLKRMQKISKGLKERFQRGIRISNAFLSLLLEIKEQIQHVKIEKYTFKRVNVDKLSDDGSSTMSEKFNPPKYTKAPPKYDSMTQDYCYHNLRVAFQSYKMMMRMGLTSILKSRDLKKIE
jgi:hypothetical protein